MPKFFLVDGIHDVIMRVRFSDDRFTEIAVLNRTEQKIWRPPHNRFTADCDQPQYFAADFWQRQLFSAAEGSSD